MSFKRAFFTVGSFTLLSRLAGFIRDVLAANFMGAGPLADAFFIALRLPNLFRRLFAEGAFTVSFVPLFAGALKEGRAAAQRFAEEALAVLLVALLPFTLVMMLFMPALMHVITPGYSNQPEQFALVVKLSRITFPYLMLISVAALLGSVLNGLGRFGPYAAAPIAFNLVQIAALVWGLPYFTSAAHALAWAVLASGAVQLVWLAVSARRAGMSLGLRWPRLTPEVRRLLVLVGPGALAAGVMQINIFIDMVLASTLPSGAISYLSYADRLYQLPVGVIGIAIGTALLPMLSATIKTGSANEALSQQNRALEFGLFLGLPAAVALAVVPGPILMVLFERGAFTPDVTAFTAKALAAYAVSIPAYMVSKVLMAGFYARENTKTPFKVSLLTVAVNVALSVLVIILMRQAGHEELAFVALALSTAFTAWLNVAVLGGLLYRAGHWRGDAQLWRRVLAIVFSAVAMGVFIYFLAGFLQPFFRSTTFTEVAALGGLVGLGGLVYLVMAQLTGAERLQDVLTALRRRPKGAALPEGEA